MNGTSGIFLGSGKWFQRLGWQLLPQMLLGSEILGKMGNQEAELNFWKEHKNGLLCVLPAQL